MEAWFPENYPWYPLFAMLSFAWGACIGSFLNVCIHRIPRDESVVSPGSHCPSCHTPIHWYHNIPLVAYVALHGKCAQCKTRISPRYVAVELLTALLFTLIWFKFSLNINAPRLFLMAPIDHIAIVPVYWLVIMGLILGTFVDFEHMIIPDRVTIGGMVLGLLLSTLVPALHGADSWLQGLSRSAIGLAAGFGSLWAVAVLGEFAFKKEAMGFGDVKLMGAIGAFFGWQAIIFTIIIASFAGTLVGVSLIMAGKKEMQSRIPFGPYLSLAAMLWMLWGPLWWNAYIRFITVT